MFTIFRNSLSRLRGQILGWGLSLGILAAWMTSLYDMMFARREQYTSLFNSFPKEMMAFFGGGDMMAMFTPSGFLNIEYFSYMTIIIGIFAILAGSGMLASEEENGTLDLVLAYPVSRAKFFIGRLLGFLVATISILVLNWLGFALIEPATKMNTSAGKLALPFFSLFGILMIFGTLALLFSMLLPSRRMAAMLSSILLIASFFITALANLDNRLTKLADFSPMDYYQGGLAMDGMEWKWLLEMLAISVLFVLVAWWRFERRDIRVAGEGSWRLPIFHRRKQVNAAPGD